MGRRKGDDDSSEGSRPVAILLWRGERFGFDLERGVLQGANSKEFFRLDETMPGSTVLGVEILMEAQILLDPFK